MSTKISDDFSMVETGRRGAEYEIREIETQAHFLACEDLQAEIWGADDFVRVPALVLITAQHNGGAVPGAFLRDGRLAGFVCSFPGFAADGRVKHCSQLLAVHPRYPSYGAWRLELREIFGAYVSAGYRVDGFRRWRRGGEPRTTYVLSRRSPV